MRLSPPSESENNMLSSMRNLRAVTTPQSVINGCMNAVETTGLGRSDIMGLPLKHIRSFVFCVQTEEYRKVSSDLVDSLTPGEGTSFWMRGGGRATMGVQCDVSARKGLCWFHGDPLPGIGVASSPEIPLIPGGGFATVHASLGDAVSWLEEHDLKYEKINLFEIDAIWIPLITPYYGVGSGYYGVYIAPETVSQTIERLAPRA